MVRTR